MFNPEFVSFFIDFSGLAVAVTRTGNMFMIQDFSFTIEILKKNKSFLVNLQYGDLSTIDFQL